MSKEICPVCYGSGSTGLGFWQECQRCFGSGVVESEEYDMEAASDSEQLPDNE